jgi:hypothetical protein
VAADTVALYHFSDAWTTVAQAAAPLAEGLGLTPTSVAAPISTTVDIPSAVFSPRALSLYGTQNLRTTDTVANLQGDLTVECWFKWTPAVTSATMEIGLVSGAKIRVARDLIQPENDHFGVAGTHGAFRTPAGFVNWGTVGEEEAGLNEWRHLALCVHSTGLVFDPQQNHDVYAPGSVGRLFLNGHAVGVPVDTIDLAGLAVHDASRVGVTMQGAGMMVDEVTVWRRDWSDNGTNVNPFSNGRGGDAGVKNALRY